MSSLRSVSTVSVGLVLLLATPGCFFVFPKNNAASREEARANAKASTDATLVERLSAARAKVKANPGDLEDARVLVQNVIAVLEFGTATRSHLDGEGLVKEASEALDAAAVAHPDKKAEALYVKGAFLVKAKKDDEAIAALRASMDAKPSPRACGLLITLLDKKGALPKEIVPLCKETLPVVEEDDMRYALLESCLKHTHATDVEGGLAWAGKANVAFFRAYTEKIRAENLRAENEVARREDGERSARSRAETSVSHAGSEPSRGSGSSAPAGPARFSLTLHNQCSKTVKLFLGKDPKFGGGTHTSLGGNTVTSYQGNEGDLIWIEDDHNNGISSTSPSGHQTMRITSSCGGFAPY